MNLSHMIKHDVSLVSNGPFLSSAKDKYIELDTHSSAFLCRSEGMQKLEMQRNVFIKNVTATLKRGSCFALTIGNVFILNHFLR